MHVYHVDAQKNRRVSEAFAAGSGAKLTHAREGYQGGPVAVYGWTRGLWGIVERAKADGADWYYIDNAYFGRDVYFRVTRNALQWDGDGVRPRGMDRLNAHALPWRDWRSDGAHILVAQQTRAWYEFVGEGSIEAWTKRVTDELREHTDRLVIVRPKGCLRSIDSDLEGCWAVVTHSSNVAVDAIIRGVPAFVLGRSAAAGVALSDLRQIEHPRRYEDRLRWAAHLAANQWTLDEMRDGTCWRDLSA